MEAILNDQKELYLNITCLIHQSWRPNGGVDRGPTFQRDVDGDLNDGLVAASNGEPRSNFQDPNDVSFSTGMPVRPDDILARHFRWLVWRLLACFILFVATCNPFPACYEMATRKPWILRAAFHHWKIVLILLAPLLLLPLVVAINTKEAKAGYVILLISIYWITSALPLAVTALLPIALLPLLDVMGTNEIASVYLRGPQFVFFCCVVLALGVEQSELHRRVALRAAVLVGVDPKWLMFAIMILSMLMSMWIANTAVAAMICPVVSSLFDVVFEEPEESQANSMEEINTPAQRKYREKVQTAMYLSVAYSCNMGGTTTLVGAGALLLKGVMDGLYPEGNGLSFPSYMALALPIAFINVGLTWLWLCFLYVGFRKNEGFIKDPSAVRKTLKKQYDDLGPVSFHQIGITCLFGLLILLWFFKAPQFMPGWASFLPNRVEIGDASVGILIVILAFIIPARPNWRFPKWSTQSYRVGGDCHNNSKTLLDWNHTQKAFPWNVILLYGGGYALSEASKVSNLSGWLSQQLSGLHSLPPFAVMVLACLIASGITEVSTNSATAAILLPILMKLAENIGRNPLYLMIPATIHCSYAFMFPAGTPVNAMVINTGKVYPSHLIKTGIVVNMYTTVICCLMTVTLGDVIFDWSSTPDWMLVKVPNTTSFKSQ